MRRNGEPRGVAPRGFQIVKDWDGTRIKAVQLARRIHPA